MRYRFLYLFVVLLGLGITACESDFIEGARTDEIQSESVITMLTQRTDGIINLTIDAPALDRFGVWIDLDGDGFRAEDGSEDVTVYNAYQEYVLSAGVKSVSVYGDITYLGAASNELTAIDITGNPFLTALNVPMNRLGSIDLSANTALERLDVSGNSIASLHVSSNTALESLWVFNNELSSLDVSNNPSLLFLDCSGNALSSLDISANAQLARLLAYNNQLTALDISNNTALNRLWLFGNPLSNTETGSLVSALVNASHGDLWLSLEPLSEDLKSSAAEKGWAVQ